MKTTPSPARRILFASRSLLLPALFGLFAACNDGGGDGQSKDIGDNNANVVLALGDSITDGGCHPAGAPYPSRVAGLTGKSVINAGTCGETAGEGAARVKGLLDKHHPGTLLVLYGANDLIQSKGQSEAINGLRAIIQAAKANKTRVYVATLLPMYGDHAIFNGGVQALNPQIISLAKAEKVGIVNLSKEFGDRRELIQEDGLHPTDAGTQIIAAAFADNL
ncbi:MAG: GDSL-type esterase/lipase family protein [Kiritimatiellia bacterium]